MRKIGVLFGLENTFPDALVQRINARNLNGISAEFIHLGAVRFDQPSPWSVIVDRVSHDVPFYRAFLKYAALSGVSVINNPFRGSADDAFFTCALAAKLGVATPPSVLLPHKHHPAGVSDRSLRNLQYPLDWDSLFDFVGFPALLKPVNGGSWRDIHPLHNRQEFFRAYDESGERCMMLQRAVDYRSYFRCFVVGQQQVGVIGYDPRRPHAERYLPGAPTPAPELLARMERDALALCRALAYDLNTVDFAVEGDVPWAMEFMNPVTDADLHSVAPEHFAWLVDAVADLAAQKAQSGKDQTPAFRARAEPGASAPKPTAKSAAAPKKPAAPKRSAMKPSVAAKKSPGKQSAPKKPAAQKSSSHADDNPAASVSAAE